MERSAKVMDMRRLLSLTRQAADDYGMIEENDTIAVGLSGGKDSLTLLHVLKSLQRFYPKHFQLAAFTVDLGFYGMRFEPLKAFCESLQVPYEIVHTQISEIVFDIKKLKNPCSLCAKLRKGALNQAALAYGCNKIAYAHHQDDFIETMLLSLSYEGRFYSFPPKTFLARTGLTLIRPFLYVPEAAIAGFAHQQGLPVVSNPCPADGHTKRQYVKEMLNQWKKIQPDVKERLFSAIETASFSDWPQKRNRRTT